MSGRGRRTGKGEGNGEKVRGRGERERERERGREGGKEGGREGGWVGGREGGWEGRTQPCSRKRAHVPARTRDVGRRMVCAHTHAFMHGHSLTLYPSPTYTHTHFLSLAPSLAPWAWGEEQGRWLLTSQSVLCPHKTGNKTGKVDVQGPRAKEAEKVTGAARGSE